MENPYEIPNLENQKNDMGTCEKPFMSCSSTSEQFGYNHRMTIRYNQNMIFSKIVITNFHEKIRKVLFWELLRFFGGSQKFSTNFSKHFVFKEISPRFPCT